MKTTTISLFILFLVLSSCVSYQSGGLSANETGANFIYQDVAIGEARSNRFLLFGGMRKDALLLEAKRDLITGRPLGIDEAYTNYTFDFKNSFILGFTRTKVTVSADVIQYTTEPPVDRYSSTFKDKMFKTNLVDSLFNIGDSTYTKDGHGGIVQSNLSKYRVRVLLTNSKDELKSVRISKWKLFHAKGSWRGFVVGDEIKYYDQLMPRTVVGHIIAFGKSSVLIRSEKGKISALAYDEIILLTDIDPK